jgi:predicted RNA binding protein YcfA (HicA-like mRNA interferase family)
MCSYKQIDWRNAEKLLRSNGYQWDKTRKTASSHRHYVNSNGDRVIINTNGKLNPMVWRRLCKEHGLVC